MDIGEQMRHIACDQLISTLRNDLKLTQRAHHEAACENTELRKRLDGAEEILCKQKQMIRKLATAAVKAVSDLTNMGDPKLLQVRLNSMN